MASQEALIIKDSGGTEVDVTASNALKVDGSAVTQPVSMASSPLPTGGATSAKQDLLLAELQLKADLTETQPVSLSSVPSHNVTNAGTFAVQASQATAANLNMTEASAAAIKTAVETIDNAISGGEMQVDVVAPLPAGTNNIGDIDVLTLPAITIAAAQTLATVTTVGAVTAITNALPAGTNAIGKLAANSGVDIGDVDVLSIAAGTNRLGKIQIVDSADADQTSAKGTQTSRFIGNQRSIDAGRNARHFMLDAYTAAPLVEAVQSVVQWYGNAAVAGTTQPAVVPAGKTLRLTNYSISTKSLATVGSAVVRIRANTGGLAVLGSPLVFSMEAGSRAGATTIAMTGGLDTFSGVFPEGLEFPAGTGLAFSMAGYGPIGTLLLEGVTRFQVFGYEY